MNEFNKKPMPNSTGNIREDIPNNKIIAIGASTGGTEATRVILSELPENCPPVVITQHIAPSFCESYVND